MKKWNGARREVGAFIGGVPLNIPPKSLCSINKIKTQIWFYFKKVNVKTQSNIEGFFRLSLHIIIIFSFFLSFFLTDFSSKGKLVHPYFEMFVKFHPSTCHHYQTQIESNSRQSIVFFQLSMIFKLSNFNI
jgi:hypothetical protein